MLNRRHSSATHTCQCSFPSFCLLWKFLEMCFMFTREKTAIQNAKPTNHPTPCTFFFFFIEGKCAGNIERKPVSGWEEWIKEIKGKQQKKDFFFLSILCMCFIARHCHPQNQELCTFWEKVSEVTAVCCYSWVCNSVSRAWVFKHL